MKQINDFLKMLRAWPEEARVAIAGILFLISAVVIFMLWRAEISYSLSPFAEESPAVSFRPPPTAGEETTPGPLAGISETLFSVSNIFPAVSVDINKEALQNGVWQTFYDLGKAVDNLIF